MKDSEIIKVMECCAMNKCDKCSIKYECRGNKIRATVIISALDLIHRQQAEIDRLNIDLKAMRGAANSWKTEVQRICKKEFDNIEIDIEAVKSEAVREFAESLKEKLKANSNYGDIYDVVAYDCIDKLMEEMGCNDG